MSLKRELRTVSGLNGLRFTATITALPQNCWTMNYPPGRDILLDIDVQGTRQILKRYPDGITIFIMPPSLEILKQRLEARGTDSPEVIAVRLENAQKEMAQKDVVSSYRHQRSAAGCHRGIDHHF